MKQIESALCSALNKYPHTPLVIAYSGGVDSQVLLHALACLKQRKLILNPITVCHVNHGLSKNADAWQMFAEQSCRQLTLSLKVCHLNVQTKAQHSLEALAREARYQALHAIYQQASLIITGHHRDDQAETFLLALKRGSGLKGLSAMTIESQRNQDMLLRPLLNISRSTLVDYAKTHGLTWVEDDSNADVRFDRNYIRHNIMPLLAARWPSITTTISRSSDHCREGQLLLDELAADDLGTCQHDEKSLQVDLLMSLSQRRFNNVIRFFLAKHHCLMPSAQQLAELYLQLNAAFDKNPAVKVGDHFFRRHQGVLLLTADFEDIAWWQTEIWLHEKECCVELPDNLARLHCVKSAGNVLKQTGQHIAMPTKNQTVTVRFTHDNPTCLPDYRQHSRPLKKVLQELNIPVWQRKRIPFIYYDDVLVAAIGFFVCQAFIPKQNKPSVLISQINT